MWTSLELKFGFDVRLSCGGFGIWTKVRNKSLCWLFFFFCFLHIFHFNFGIVVLWFFVFNCLVCLCCCCCLDVNLFCKVGNNIITLCLYWFWLILWFWNGLLDLWLVPFCLMVSVEKFLWLVANLFLLDLLAKCYCWWVYEKHLELPLSIVI